MLVLGLIFTNSIFSFASTEEKIYTNEGGITVEIPMPGEGVGSRSVTTVGIIDLDFHLVQIGSDRYQLWTNVKSSDLFNGFVGDFYVPTGTEKIKIAIDDWGIYHMNSGSWLLYGYWSGTFDL